MVKESSSTKEVVSGHKWHGENFFCELAASEKPAKTFLSCFLLLWHMEHAREKEKKKECSRAVSVISIEDAPENLQEQDS